MDQRKPFDLREFSDEIAAARANPVATRLLLENDRVRIWEIGMEPRQRLLFHEHGVPYLWVCVEGGRQRSRRSDGTILDVDMPVGRAYWSDLPDGAEVHSIENIGETIIRFTTVEIVAPMAGAPVGRQYGTAV